MVNGTTACAPARSLSQPELFKLLLLESYRIDYLWGTLTPRAGIEHIQEMADTAVQPTVTSIRFGLTALHRDGGILTVDHSTTQAGIHTFRAALKMKF